MTTVVANPKTTVSVTTDKVHVDLLRMKHHREQVAPTQMYLQGCLYGYDDDGNKHFDDDTFRSNFADAGTTVVGAHCAKESQTLGQAVAELELAKDHWQTEYLAGRLSDLDLLALFDLSISRMFEIDGKLTIAGLD